MKVIHKSRKEVIELPFVIGETYITKMATGWTFTVDRIERDPKTDLVRILYGRYSNAPELLNCPMYPDRLISKTREGDRVIDECFCPHCKEQIKL